MHRAYRAGLRAGGGYPGLLHGRRPAGRSGAADPGPRPGPRDPGRPGAQRQPPGTVGNPPDPGRGRPAAGTGTAAGGGHRPRCRAARRGAGTGRRGGDRRVPFAVRAGGCAGRRQWCAAGRCGARLVVHGSATSAGHRHQRGALPSPRRGGSHATDHHQGPGRLACARCRGRPDRVLHADRTHLPLRGNGAAGAAPGARCRRASAGACAAGGYRARHGCGAARPWPGGGHRRAFGAHRRLAGGVARRRPAGRGTRAAAALAPGRRSAAGGAAGGRRRGDGGHRLPQRSGREPGASRSRLPGRGVVHLPLNGAGVPAALRGQPAAVTCALVPRSAHQACRASGIRSQRSAAAPTPDTHGDGASGDPALATQVRRRTPPRWRARRAASTLGRGAAAGRRRRGATSCVP